MIKVRVSEAGGVFAEVEVEEGSTIDKVLRSANVRTDVQKTITVNGDEAELNDIVEHGDTVYIVPNVKGNLAA